MIFRHPGRPIYPFDYWSTASFLCFLPLYFISKSYLMFVIQLFDKCQTAI